jgi:hypothetical protein
VEFADWSKLLIARLRFKYRQIESSKSTEVRFGASHESRQSFQIPEKLVHRFRVSDSLNRIHLYCLDRAEPRESLSKLIERVKDVNKVRFSLYLNLQGRDLAKRLRLHESLSVSLGHGFCVTRHFIVLIELEKEVVYIALKTV